jgi:ADP-ribosylglycohydrolase
MKDKVKAVMIGHAVADALGVPVEFLTREKLDENPVTDMRGFGTHKVPAGAWSDDTSMALCTLQALVEYGIDYDSVMLNFAQWCYRDGFTSTGVMFDIGVGCCVAIDYYVTCGKSYLECGRRGERDNGNGSLMRIHPVVLYLAEKDMPIEEKIEIVHTMSALTHAHDRSKIGCGIYAFVLWELLKNPTMSALNDGLAKAKAFYQGQDEFTYYARIFEPNFAQTPRDLIKSTGYVVDTLEASIWCVLTTNSYKEATLKAVNLGEDTDTVGAVAGGLAGALYGYEAIPKEWRETLLKREYIEEMCDKLV